MLRMTRFLPIAGFRAAVAIVACFATGAAAQAAMIGFANFHLLNATQPLSFTNNGGTSATLQALNVPIVFNYTSQSGLPTIDRAATLVINPAGTANTTIPATAAGILLDQPVQPVRFSIIENGTGKNLLSMLPTNSDLVGISGQGNASLSASSAGVFSSDYATFSPTLTQSYNLGLATLNVPLAVGPGGFLNSFVANVGGQFSVDSSGFTPKVPEPATAMLAGLGFLAVIAKARRKWRRRMMAG